METTAGERAATLTSDQFKGNFVIIIFVSRRIFTSAVDVWEIHEERELLCFPAKLQRDRQTEGRSPLEMSEDEYLR